MRRIAALALMLAAVLPAPANADSLRDLVREQRIQTYTASRKAQDVYETRDGYLILTHYCYEYVYYADVFFSGGKIYFVDSGNSCQVEKIYRDR